MLEWCPFAVRRDGPQNKRGGYTVGDYAAKRGEVKHSMVGSYAGALSVLDSPAPSSWHFSILKSGAIFQHYALTANCWHGNDSDNDQDVRANIDLIGIEHEGGAPGNVSEPLTAAQLNSSIEVSRWAAAQFGLTSFARFPEQWGVWTLAEHNQVGNAATACPSNRIPWNAVLEALTPPPAPPPPDYIPHDLEALGAFLRAVTTRQRVIWADQSSGLVEVVTDQGQPMEPRHFFYT